MSIKKINIVMTLFTAFGICFSGCKKNLELSNPNSQTADNFWESSDDALNGVTAAYNSLILAYMRTAPVMLDVRGDDVRSNSPWDQIYNSARFSMSADNAIWCTWSYGIYYQGVFRANQVLDNVPAIENIDPDIKNRILGQAYFLRGLYFYHLVNKFGNVSLPVGAPKSMGDMLVGQSTVQQGWDQVISDFKTAAGLLPVSYNDVTGTDRAQVGRATKGAAMAFLGKAYLFNKKYTEAAEQFKAVMDLQIYSLVTNYRDNFTEQNENNSESIFEVQFNRDLGGKNAISEGQANPTAGDTKTSLRATTYGARGFGWTDVQPTRSVLSEFLFEKTADGKDDPRCDATLFYNKPGVVLYGVLFSEKYASNPIDLNDVFCRKYQNDASGLPDEFEKRSGINERIMRYADVLLMYAECLNELNQTPQAYDFIQQVRTRVGLPNLQISKPSMSQDEMREQIAHERLLEFCLEGHRFDDIHRWGWLQDPEKLAMLKTRDLEFNSYKPGREFYLIPQGDIDNNPGFVQNSSY